MIDFAKPVRVTDLVEMKRRGQKIAVLTAYDATFARLLDRAGMDVLLVGDSLGMVVLGHDTTLPVTLDDMVRHTAAVSRGTSRALVVADMPFLTFHTTPEDAIRNAGRLMQEGGAAAVKLEGGVAMAEVVHRLVSVGIPVMGHVGLLPQSVHALGGYRQQGGTPESAELLRADARALQDAGAFSIVLESIPDAVALNITSELAIPTIGIGAGPGCDGQVLVSYDALGLYDERVPSFVKQYAQLARTVLDAGRSYAEEVRAGRFPAPSRAASGAKRRRQRR